MSPPQHAPAGPLDHQRSLSRRLVASLVCKHDPHERRRPLPGLPLVIALCERSSDLTGEASLVIELAGGRVLRLPEAISAQRLAELVQALEASTPR